MTTKCPTIHMHNEKSSTELHGKSRFRNENGFSPLWGTWSMRLCSGFFFFSNAVLFLDFRILKLCRRKSYASVSWSRVYSSFIVKGTIFKSSFTCVYPLRQSNVVRKIQKTLLVNMCVGKPVNYEGIFTNKTNVESNLPAEQKRLMTAVMAQHYHIALK